MSTGVGHLFMKQVVGFESVHQNSGVKNIPSISAQQYCKSCLTFLLIPGLSRNNMLVHILMLSFCLFLPELCVVQFFSLIFIGEKVMHIHTLHLISHHMGNFNYSNFGSGTCGSFGNSNVLQNN